MQDYLVLSIASSADGNKLAAAGRGSRAQLGPFFTSTNAGAAWIQANVPNNAWTSVASSADGTKLVAVSETAATPAPPIIYGQIYTSTNSGLAWTLSTAPGNWWISVSSSVDGTKLVAGGWQSPIFSSTDSGTTWTQANAPNGSCFMASSADGTKLIAAYNNGGVYTSTNSGCTWISNNAPITSWTSVASSADGNKMVAVGGDLIYSTQITPAPTLNITPTNGNLMLSWIIPSTNFVLLQSCDLQSWTAMTNQPVLNLTNLQNQVVLSSPNSNCFYRLASP